MAPAKGAAAAAGIAASLLIILFFAAQARAEPGHRTMGFTCVDVQYVLATRSWSAIDALVSRMGEDDKKRAMQCLTRSQQAKVRARYGK